MDLSGLLRVAQDFAESLPPSATAHLAKEIDALKVCPAPERLVSLGSTSHSRELLARLAAEWAALGEEIDGRLVATALLAASQVVAASPRERVPEIAWTGPFTKAVPTRRVDQVLYELIAEARSEIWLASYVAYGADRAIGALAAAAARGVAVRLVLELAAASGGKLAFDTARQIKAHIPMAKIHFWPLERREVDDQGRRGIFHAKCLIADRSAALISSANLTDHALELNMELGLVVRNSDVPRRLAEHLELLCLQGELRELT